MWDNPRLLFIDHTSALGGSELCLLDIARAWRARGCVVLFEDGPLARRLGEAGVRVQVLPGKGLRGLTRQSSLKEAWEGLGKGRSLSHQVAAMAKDYDILYANSPKALGVARWAGWKARRPVVWHLHDIIHHSHFRPWQCHLLRFLGRTADRVIANSRASAVALGGGRVEVVYNGIDTRRFAPDAFKPVAAASPLVGLFGRIAPWKGQHVFLEALSMIEEVHGVVVGEALFGEENYARSLPALARALSVEGRLHWPGFQEDVRPWMGACDIVVHTSTAPEPFGRVIVEAMLLEKPVIASRGGGVEEIVEHGVTGLLVPPGDAGALAGAIREMLDCPKEAARMAARAREKALERFSMEGMIQGIASAMKGLC